MKEPDLRWANPVKEMALINDGWTYTVVPVSVVQVWFSCDRPIHYTTSILVDTSESPNY